MNNVDALLTLATALSISDPSENTQRRKMRKVGSGKNRAKIKKSRKAKIKS